MTAPNWLHCSVCVWVCVRVSVFKTQLNISKDYQLCAVPINNENHWISYYVWKLFEENEFIFPLPENCHAGIDFIQCFRGNRWKKQWWIVTHLKYSAKEFSGTEITSYDRILNGFLIQKLAMLISEAKINQGNSFEQIFFNMKKCCSKLAS